MVDPALLVHEIRAPKRVAPFAAAVAVDSRKNLGAQPLGRSSLVILWDDNQFDVWGGRLRLIGQMRIQIDAELGWDPILAEAVWTGLTQNLAEAGADYHNLVGTVTRELSESFGGLELRESSLNLEVRCSWTALSANLAPHLEGWAGTVLQAAGIPASTLPPRRLGDDSQGRVHDHASMASTEGHPLAQVFSIAERQKGWNKSVRTSSRSSLNHDAH